VRTCHFHDDRPGVGICMRCRMVVCAACCTRLNGVNHCHACLKALGAKREEAPGSAGLWVMTAALLLGTAWIGLFGLCWAFSGRMSP
jgi:hypothetical protein